MSETSQPNRPSLNEFGSDIWSSRQSQAWLQSRRSIISAIIQEHPDLQNDALALLELIDNELELRRQSGESPSLEEYQERFPQVRDALKIHWEISNLLSSEPACDAGGAIELFEGRYQLLERLGQGGSGVAYRAWDTRLKRLVALKWLRAGAFASEDDRVRFHREAEAIARVQHPCVVQVYDVGESDISPYIAMEFCGGGSLADRIRIAPLPPREAAELMCLIGAGVEAAHQMQIIHRDLKPANVLLHSPESGAWSSSTTKIANATTSDARQTTVLPGLGADQVSMLHPKVCDFGLAKLLDSEQDQTRTGNLLGTPAYMAPEQAMGTLDQMGPCTDVYAMGAILYECLTGAPPFRGATSHETLELVRTREPIPPRHVQPSVPIDLETIVLHCLRKEPSQRYSSAIAVVEDLRRFLDGKGILARRHSMLERLYRWSSRNRELAAMLALAILLTALLIGGSVRVAIVLKKERDAAIAAEGRAVSAENQQRQELYRAYILEARSSRASPEVGHRQRGLAAVRSILATIPWEELTLDQQTELRDEALASLALVDAHSVTESSATIPVESDWLPAIDPTFRWLAYADKQRRIQLVDLVSGENRSEQIRPIELQSANSGFLHFNSDGRWLIEFSTRLPEDSCFARVCEMSTGIWSVPVRMPRILEGSAATASDTLYGMHSDDCMHIWSLPELHEIAVSPRLGDYSTLAATEDGKRVAVASPELPVDVLDTQTWKSLGSNSSLRGVTKLTWTPDGQSLVFGNGIGELIQWWPWEPNQVKLVNTIPHGLSKIDFEKDGDLFATSHFDNSFQLRRLGGDQLLVLSKGRFLGFSPNGRRFAYFDRKQVHVSELTQGKALLVERKPAVGIQFTPDQQWLVVGGREGAKVVSPVTMKEVAYLGTDACGPVAIHPDGSEWATFGIFTKVWRWPIEKRESTLDQVGPAHRQSFGSITGMSTFEPQYQGCHVCWRPDGKEIAIADYRHGRLLIADSLSSESPRVHGSLLNLARVEYSPDGRWIAGSAAIHPAARVWSAEDGTVVLDMPQALNVAFSKRLPWLAVGFKDRIEFYNTRNWQLDRTLSLTRTDNVLVPMAFQPKGSWLAYSPEGGKISLYDCDLKRNVATLTDPENRHFQDLNFSPDGSRLAFTCPAWDYGYWDLDLLRSGLEEVQLPTTGWPERIRTEVLPVRSLKVDRGDMPSPSTWSQYWLTMGSGEFYKGNMTDAASAIGLGLSQLRPDASREERVSLLAMRAQYQYLANNYPAAEEDLREAVNLLPLSPQAVCLLARLNLFGPEEKRQPLDAIRWLSPLVVALPQDQEARMLLGITHTLQENWPTAIEMLQSVTEERFLPMSQLFLSVALRGKGEDTTAASMFELAQQSYETHSGKMPLVDKHSWRQLVDRLRKSVAPTQ